MTEPFNPFYASIEEKEGQAKKHGFHLGTQEDIARDCILTIAKGYKLRRQRFITIALMRNARIVDVWDGKDWLNDYLDRSANEYAEGQEYNHG